MNQTPTDQTLAENSTSNEAVASETRLRSGDVLDGRFEIVGVISRGGMATVLKARDLQEQGQIVAVKVPHRDYECSPAFFSRFQREEEIGCRLNHPFVLRFVPVAGAKSRPYLVTEYLRGVTLADLLDQLKVFPEADALAIAGMICEALEYLHEEEVIHRDLKPENVMVCYDGSIRLMDFGIAHAAESRRITFAGFAPGTPHYMAPERVERKRGDRRTDIYSLGAILYQMLTGAIAFEDDDALVIMNARVTGDPVAPRQLQPVVSPQAEEIVLRAMDRDPDNRFPSAASMKSALDAPHQVEVTGRSKRLEVSTPWRRGWRKARYVAFWIIVPVAVQILLFLFLSHHGRRR